jgi:hypothetical protein
MKILEEELPISKDQFSKRFSTFRFLFYAIVFIERITTTELKENEGFLVSNLDLIYDNSFWNIIPSPETYNTLNRMCAMVALSASFNIMYEITAIITALLYTIIFYSIQIENNTHHYLIVYLLWIIIFLDKKSWIMKLFTYQFSIMYFWSVITKLNYNMLFNNIMIYQIMRGNVYKIVEYISYYTFISDIYIYNIFVISTVIIEIYLMIGWFIASKYEKINWITIICGISFHLTIQLSGLKVGFLGFYIICCNWLIIP